MSQQNKKIALTITANTRQLRQDMRQAGGEVRAFGRQIDGLGAKMRNMRMRMQQSGVFGRGGGALKTAAGFAGVYGIQQMFQGAKEESAALTDIAITGNLTDKQLQKLRNTMFEISNATGKSTGELTKFVATVTTMTGDAAGAQSALSGIADVMVATGASGEALAGTYVKLTTTMGLLPKQAREAFNVLRSQEKLGSITMANIAANFGKVIGAAGVFGQEGKGIKGVRTMGGLYQIAQRGFAVGQEGEAATSAGSFLGFLGRRAKQVKKTFGVDVFDKAGNARDMPTVFEELGKSFNKNREAFRTKGQLIFGRSGIRTAQQLALAANAPGGFGGKMGAFSSANSLLRTAGGVDEITADKARRERSAAFQFDKQINIIKNSFQKHMIPVFKSLAGVMKEFGPDMVKIIKFMLDNSSALLKLWLGYKGVTFFKNLMAPIQGGAGGGVAGVAGMGAGAGGGMVMGPGGQMVPASAGSRIGARGRGYGFFSGAAAMGSAGGFGMAGMGGPRVGAGGAWGVRGGGQRLGRFARASQFIGRQQGRLSGRTGGLGMAAGMGSMFMDTPPGMFKGQGMVENVGLMSGNPYAMLAAAVSKGATYGRATGDNTPGMLGAVIKGVSGGAIHTADDIYKYATNQKDPGLLTGTFGNLADAASKLGSVFQKVAQETPQNLTDFYGGKWQGFEEKQRQDALMKKYGFTGNYTNQGSGHLSKDGQSWVTTEEAGTMGMSPEGRVGLANKLGSKGLKSLHGRLGGEAALARSRVVSAMLKADKNAVINEDTIRAAPGAGHYNQLSAFAEVVNKLILQLQKGLPVTIENQTPGSRLTQNNSSPGDYATGGKYGAQ